MEIKEYLNLCKASYDDTTQSMGHHTCVDYITEQEENLDVQAKVFVNHETKELVFAIRGTENITDIITDLNTQKEKVCNTGIHNYCYFVHKGFLMSARLIQNIVETYIEEIRPTKIIFTGHSLGGAVATILATHCGFTSLVRPNCITFGSPRAGNKAFTAAFDTIVNESIRVVNGLDPITKIPPALLGFRHVRGLHKIGDGIVAAGLKSYGCKTKLLEYHFLDDYAKNLV